MTLCCSVPQCPHPYRGVTMSHVMQKTPGTVSGFNRCQCCTRHPPPPEMQSPCPREGFSGFFRAAFCYFGWEMLGAWLGAVFTLRSRRALPVPFLGAGQSLALGFLNK